MIDHNTNYDWLISRLSTNDTSKKAGRGSKKKKDLTDSLSIFVIGGLWTKYESAVMFWLKVKWIHQRRQKERKKNRFIQTKAVYRFIKTNNLTLAEAIKRSENNFQFEIWDLVHRAKKREKIIVDLTFFCKYAYLNMILS